MYDFLIIGAGVSGALIARDLSRYHCRVGIIEKENDVANGVTGGNSAMIHSGHDPKDGTMKMKMNIRGNAMYEELCRDLKVDLWWNGAMVVAVGEDELPGLHFLYNQAVARNIPCTLLNREEALALEPNLSDGMIAGLDLPTTGLVSPWELTIAAIEDAMNNGVELFLAHKVTSIDMHPEYYDVHTTKGDYQARFVINCAGLFADDIYHMVSDSKAWGITPRKGEYFILDKANPTIVRRTIYPLPSEKGKGVLVIPTVHHNVLLGPSSELVTDRDAIDNTYDVLEYVRREVGKCVKNIPMAENIRTYAGIRPTGTGHDFIIEEAPDAPRFVNVAAIESPGLVSAPAISEYVLNEIIAKKFDFVAKTEPRIERKPWIIINRMTPEEKQQIVATDPKFAQMICRCEHISEGEIVDIIHRNCGARTVKGVKRRARPGAGRCQGGFCEPKIVNILARELHISPLDVLLDGDDSILLKERTKG
jgi:glycerol-3-phosphate dehydrogenase